MKSIAVKFIDGLYIALQGCLVRCQPCKDFNEHLIRPSKKNGQRPSQTIEKTSNIFFFIFIVSLIGLLVGWFQTLVSALIVAQKIELLRGIGFVPSSAVACVTESNAWKESCFMKGKEHALQTKSYKACDDMNFTKSIYRLCYTFIRKSMYLLH